MTVRIGACAHCGAQAQIGELVVYARAPGAVIRCRACGKVVIVLTRIRDALRADLAGFRLAGG